MDDKAFEAACEKFVPGVIHSDKPVLVEFLASRCDSSCALSAAVIMLAAEYAGKLDVITLNLDGNPDLVAAFGLIGIPALILIQEGKAHGAASRFGAILHAQSRHRTVHLIHN